MTFTKENKIESAIITGSKEISIKLSVPAKNTETTTQQIKLVDKDGMIVLLKDVKPIIGQKYIEFPNMKSNFVLEYIITTVNDLELVSVYTVSKVGYEKITVSVGYVYDTDVFKDIFTYTNNDLGYIYKKENTTFKVWSPLAKTINLLIFEKCDKENKEIYSEKYEMNKDIKGTWSLTLMGDYKNKYYLYEVNMNDKINTVVDPYAKAVGVNGLKAMVVDLKSTDPEGFKHHKKPKLQNNTDAIIYGLHLSNLSPERESDINHIKDLGFTHVQLLPCFDFNSINEKTLEKNEFNGNISIKEFKEMVMKLHENDLRVIVDVVYTRTYNTLYSNLNTLVPNYYYRFNENGNFSNGSGFGNEIASEREMARRLIIDSVVYLATEYNIDGFRFDLMGLTDIDTMNMIRHELNKIDKTILVYGEGFISNKSELPDSSKSIKQNMSKLDRNIAIFSNDIQDSIKGNIFDGKEESFVAGTKLKDFWAISPTQTLNTLLCDELISSTKENEQSLYLNKLLAAIIFTSQGIPFFQGGDTDLFEYYKGLISLRKKYNAFRLINSKDVVSNIRFLDTPNGLIAYNLKNTSNNDYKEFMVIFNATKQEQTFKINAYADVLVNESAAGTKIICTLNNEVVVKGIGAYVLGIKDESDISLINKEDSNEKYISKFQNMKLPIISLLGIVCSIGLVRHFFRKKKN